MWFRKNRHNLVYYLLSIFSAIALVTLQNHRYQKVATEIANPDYLERERKSQIALNLRRIVPSFGFDNLQADSIYLDFVQYFGNEKARKATGYSLTPEYFSAIADRDPRFIDAYLTLATANSMYAGKAEKTVDLMNRILENNDLQPQNIHLLWTTKAIDETLFLGDIKAAKRSYKQAAKLAAADPETINNDFNLQKIQFLATNPDPTNAQIIAWKSVLPYVVKESEKQKISELIQDLEAKNTN